jgi:type I restriction enzyme S subunit
MSEWRKFKWDDLITLEYGKLVSDKERKDGIYPVYGTNGQIGTSNLPPICSYASLIIERKGDYRGIHFSDRPFSVIDTAFYVKAKTDSINLKWVYFAFLTYDIDAIDSGSAIPSTAHETSNQTFRKQKDTLREIFGICVNLPSLCLTRKYCRQCLQY